MRSMCAKRQYRDVSKSLIIIILVTLAVAVQALHEPGPDIDECAEGTSGCAHTCTDTANSYICSCHPGYRLALDGRLCDDIDECAESVFRCEHNCSNTVGSYSCHCNAGYRLRSDGHTCADINECTEGKAICEHNCSNTEGSYTCRCNAGYRLRSDGHTCADIDECTEGMARCEHNCSNTVGSYSCRCKAGYRLTSDGHTCADIDECVQSPCNMQHKFTCQNTNGSYECVCEAGYKEVEPHECHDIDECDTLTNDCTLYENMTCENTIGSYKCVLRQGVNRNSTIIAVIVCVVVGVFLIIVAAVCFIKRAKTKLRNKQETAEDRQDTEVVYEEFNPNSNHTESQATHPTYEALDLSNRQQENFYQPLETQPKTYAHVYDNATNTST